MSEVSVKTVLAETLKEEKDLLESGKSTIERAQAIVNLSEKIIEIDEIEIQEEKKQLKALLDTIKSFTESNGPSQ